MNEIVELVLEHDGKSIASFHASISAEPQCAGWIRALALTIAHDRVSITHERQQRIAQIIQKTAELRHLRVLAALISEYFMTSCFRHLRALHILESGFGHSLSPSSFILFLNRHPTISHLAIASLQFDRKLVDLPNLVALQWLGSVDNLCSFQNCKRLSALWFIMKESDTLDNLAYFPACHGVMIMLANVDNPTAYLTRIFSGLRHHLPSLQSLFFVFSSQFEASTVQRIILAELAHFDQMECFGIYVSEVQQFGQDTRNMINSWIDTCPTLRHCLFREKRYSKTSFITKTDLTIPCMNRSCSAGSGDGLQAEQKTGPKTSECLPSA
ncbi:hypothetical protein C8J56DRAFT_398488 [Mycena floridula]|nr:hypothetical protein C8J56DRAFT_398488 [Mycena floridula]